MSSRDGRVPGPPRRRGALPGARRTVQVVLGLGLAVALLVWGLPYFARTSWGEVLAVLGSVPLSTALALGGLVLLGLYSYTFTLTGSLPGLRHGQALIVNICGSSVGNLLPGGGAAGLAATYTICRSWGFSRRDISTSAIVTGVWNVLARMALPVVAILGLSAGAENVPPALADAALAGSLTGIAVIAVFVAVLVSERAALAVGNGLDRVLAPLTRRRRGDRTMSVRALVVDLRARISDVVRTGWLPMTLGLSGFFGVYFVLFVLVLRATGVDLYYGEMFAAYAIGRLLTAVGVTPGGLGVTETATAAAMVAWGADPAASAAAVVLFSIYTHLLEVPLGALAWLAWTLSPKAAAAEAPEPHAADPATPPGGGSAGSSPRPRSRRPG